MFLKPFKIKADNTMKSSDRKKMRHDILEQIPGSESEVLSDILPQKGQITATKVQTHGGETVSIISLDKEPVFFHHDSGYFPTVYTCWKYPDLLYSFPTWANVITRLTGGADLMLPGIVIQNQTSETLAHIRSYQACAVHVVGNRAALAVGDTCMTGESMYNSGMRGKGLKIKHFYGDQLWLMGSKLTPPTIEQPILQVLPDPPEDYDDQEEEEQADGDDASAEDVAGAMAAAAIGEDSDQPDEPDEAEVEETDRPKTVAETLNDLDTTERFYQCFLYALKRKLKKIQLPMTTRQFQKDCVLVCCPAGVEIDVKKTKYKKLTTFLQEMSKQGFIKMKDPAKGSTDYHITEFNPDHPEVEGFRPWSLGAPMVEQEVDTSSSSYVFQPPRILELLAVNAQTLPFFSRLGFGKGDIINPADIRDLVTGYIKKKGLQDEQNKQLVRLDQVMFDTLKKKKEGYFETLSWNDIFNRLRGSLSQVHQIVYPHGHIVTKKGLPIPITLKTEKRTGNKKVTLVHNLDLFGIDLKVIAKDIKTSKACSTSITQTPTGSQLLAQGSHAKFISKLLQEKYNLHQKYVDIKG